MLPTVHVNCASSIDGKIAGRDRRQLRISSDEDMRRVHALRYRSDAILVGVGTIVADDPKLTVKYELVDGLADDEGKQPAVVIIDPRGRCPVDALALNTETVFLVMLDDSIEPEGLPEHVQLIRAGTGDLDLETMLEELGKQGIESILVEGGGETMWGFFSKGLVSTMTLYIGPMVIGGKDAPTVCDGDGNLSGDLLPEGKLVKVERSGEGVVLHYDFD